MAARARAASGALRRARRQQRRPSSAGGAAQGHSADTPLGRRLAQRIAAEGPISFAEYMDCCMRDPEHGYFTTKQGIIGGRSGADFITAPELLPEFSWCVAQWVSAAVEHIAPPPGQPISLVELGPGTGRMMADVLGRLADCGMEALLARMHVTLVEVSPVLRAEQSRRLAPLAPLTAGITQAGDLEEALAKGPAGAPMVCISNEFFDVLPVHVVQCVSPGEWGEQLVALSEDGAEFQLLPGAPPLPAPVSSALSAARAAAGAPGDRLELCPQALAVAGELGRRIERTGGMALAIDYGGDRPSRLTLQGMRGQVTCSPLLHPGEVDISWHVDFDAMREHLAALGLSVALTSAMPQGDFLARLGIGDMIVERAAAAASDTERAEAMRRYKMLTEPAQMGGYHRAVVMCDKLKYPPPPFWRTAPA